MEENKKRTLRVYGTSGYNYKETPTIMLKGQWLKEFGFEPGQYFEVQCEDGKLTITKTDAPQIDESKRILSKLSKEEKSILAEHYKSIYAGK